MTKCPITYRVGCCGTVVESTSPDGLGYSIWVWGYLNKMDCQTTLILSKQKKQMSFHLFLLFALKFSQNEPCTG